MPWLIEPRLATFRESVAEALTESANGNDIAVLDTPADAVSPPAYMLQWAEPWLERSTACAFRVALDLWCISARVDPDPGVEFLELMVESALGDLNRARIPGAQVASSPGPLELGGVRYLAARITVYANLNLGA